MLNTRSQLKAAKLYDEDKNVSVDCMFNPYEYSVSKNNAYTERPKNQYDAPVGNFTKAGAQSLRLELFFDTYEAGEDVSKKYTDKLWKFMETKTKVQADNTKKVSPPYVIFEWGVFSFKAVITDMTQRFTLFKVDGTPVRAKVSVTFKKYIDEKDFPGQNPTSGGGDVERVWRVVAGDRLDAIAYEVYGDTSNWRVIAERNKVRDPLALRPGQTLNIPILGK
jgi:hypothetical protein